MSGYLNSDDASAPATRWATLAADNNEIPEEQRPKALYVTGAGDLCILGEDDNMETFPVTVGQVLPVRPKVVTNNGTATVIGLY